MSDIAIKVENLSKAYQIGDFGTGSLSNDIGRWWAMSRGKGDPYLTIDQQNNQQSKGANDIVWSLKDINLEIKQGVAVGIIGRNGAGKSTLLKILSRVTSPTSGNIKIKGRVASLLEVGTGFHPELTGRENIFLNGAILGMRKAEIKKHFDAIVDFADVERYIDTPVKRYSSGMYVRLAFAVAAHLESEILIVDEVLAVGDAEFQKKCLGKMGGMNNSEGRTILFVSHNIAAINSFCQSGIILSNGAVDLIGDIHSAIEHYEKSADIIDTGVWINTDTKADSIFLKSISIKNALSKLTSSFTNIDKITVEFELQCIEDCKNVKVGFDLLKKGEVVFRSQQVDDQGEDTFLRDTTYLFKCEIPAQLLNAGEYSLRPLLSIHCVRSLIDFFEPVLSFNVVINKDVAPVYHAILNSKNNPGSVFPILKWSF